MSVAKTILFVCVENSCRSQIAEGFARKIGGGRVRAFSGGSRPSGVVNPAAIEVMREVGIDLSTHHSKSFEELGAEKFDIVVTMGCGDACPFIQAALRIDWQIPDPKGKSREFFCEIRDKIRDHITRLFKDHRITD